MIAILKNDAGNRIIKMKAIPFEKLKVSPRIEKRMEMNVAATAASWGDFSNGAAMKKDQLAKDSLGRSGKLISNKSMKLGARKTNVTNPVRMLMTSISQTLVMTKS